MAELSLKLPSGLLSSGYPRVKTGHSSRPPVNFIEGSEKSPRGVGIVHLFVCCSVQMETLQCFDLTFRNNNLHRDLINILGSEERMA
jgi:hypothetical protein